MRGCCQSASSAYKDCGFIRYGTGAATLYNYAAFFLTETTGIATAVLLHCWSQRYISHQDVDCNNLVQMQFPAVWEARIGENSELNEYNKSLRVQKEASWSINGLPVNISLDTSLKPPVMLSILAVAHQDVEPALL